MILAVLVLVLIITGMSLFLFFLFTLYLPSLSGKRGNATDLLFTRERFDGGKGLAAFKWMPERVDYSDDREGRLFFSLYYKDARRAASPEQLERKRERQKKDFQFWKKCYTLVYGKHGCHNDLP